MLLSCQKLESQGAEGLMGAVVNVGNVILFASFCVLGSESDFEANIRSTSSDFAIVFANQPAGMGHKCI